MRISPQVLSQKKNSTNSNNMYRKCFISIFLFLCAFAFCASAQFVFGDHVIKVLDLPNTEEFVIEAEHNNAQQLEYMGQQKYGDLGIAHKQFSFVVPVWNYGEPEYVIYREKKMYDATSAKYIERELSLEEVAYFHEMYGIPMTPKIPFWDKWGGPLVLLFLIGLCFV